MSKLKKFFIFILISLIAFSIFMLILGMNLSKEVKEKFSHEYLSKMPATIYGRVITLQPGFTIPKNELVEIMNNWNSAIYWCHKLLFVLFK